MWLSADYSGIIILKGIQPRAFPPPHPLHIKIDATGKEQGTTFSFDDLFSKKYFSILKKIYFNLRILKYSSNVYNFSSEKRCINAFYTGLPTKDETLKTT